jgi:hypothetical protein
MKSWVAETMYVAWLCAMLVAVASIIFYYGFSEHFIGEVLGALIMPVFGLLFFGRIGYVWLQDKRKEK